MEEPATKLTDLQFVILNGMADDYEDIEQLYLCANLDLDGENVAYTFPQVRFPLREITDEVRNMLHEGYIEAKYSNDEKLVPLHPIELSEIHHYWFGATAKGRQAWEAHPRISRP